MSNDKQPVQGHWETKDNPKPENLAQNIYDALKSNGAEIGNYSLHIIQQVLDRHEINTLPIAQLQSAPEAVNADEIAENIIQEAKSQAGYSSRKDMAENNLPESNYWEWFILCIKDLIIHQLEYAAQSAPKQSAGVWIEYTKWIRENWFMSTDENVWLRREDFRDQRTDEALYHEYTPSQQLQSQQQEVSIDITNVKTAESWYMNQIEDYKHILLNFTDCPIMVINNPGLLRGKLPTDKDIAWAQKEIKEFEVISVKVQDHTLVAKVEIKDKIGKDTSFDENIVLEIRKRVLHYNDDILAFKDWLKTFFQSL